MKRYIKLWNLVFQSNIFDDIDVNIKLVSPHSTVTSSCTEENHERCTEENHERCIYPILLVYLMFCSLIKYARSIIWSLPSFLNHLSLSATDGHNDKDEHRRDNDAHHNQGHQDCAVFAGQGVRGGAVTHQRGRGMKGGCKIHKLV